jgi:hypothetical protein
MSAQGMSLAGFYKRFHRKTLPLLINALSPNRISEHNIVFMPIYRFVNAGRSTGAGSFRGPPAHAPTINNSSANG